MSDEAQALLDAEKVVQELATELRNLKSETERYATAQTTVAQARDHLTAVAERLRAHTEGLQQVVDAIRKTGTAELVAGMDALASTLTAANAEITAAREAVGAADQRSAKGLGDIRVDLASRTQQLTEAVNTASSNTAKDTARLGGDLSARIGQLQEVGASQAVGLLEAMHALSLQVKTDGAGTRASVDSVLVAAAQSAEQATKRAVATNARMHRLLIVAIVLAGLASLLSAGTLAWLVLR